MRVFSKTKIIFIILLAPLWASCLFLGVETVWRAYGNFRYVLAHRRISSIHHNLRIKDDVVYQKVRAASPPPDSVLWQLPPREKFFDLDETGRHNLAEERREMILICDMGGVAIDIYPCTATPELSLLAERIKPGDALAVLLPSEEMQDALAAIRQVGTDNKLARDYYLSVADDAKHLMEFNVLRLMKSSPKFAMFLGDSRYEIMGYAYRPNIYRQNWYTAQFLNSDFWTNSATVRDREIISPKPDGMIRIVCVGGSTTVEGPHNDLTYPKLIEGLLRARFDTENIEVINCGVDAMGFPHEYERMRDWLAFEPDMIIHYNIINTMPAVLEHAVRKSEMLKGWAGRLRLYASRSRFLVALAPNRFLPEEPFITAEIEFHAIRCLADMAAAAQKSGASLAVASFATPNASHISKDERLYFDNSFHVFPLARATTADYNWTIGLYNNMVREFCDKHNLLYIPVAENFSGGIDTFTDICHMRLRGIELKAQIMAEHLEAFVRVRLTAKQENSHEHKK